MLNMACRQWWFSCCCVNLFIIALGFSIVIAERAEERIPSQDELLQNVPELGNIPGRFASFNISSTKTEDVEKPFRDMCEKNGGPAAYSTAREGLTIFPQCIQSLVNVTELKSEIEAAKPHGELDIVFGNYCRRIPILEMCIRNMTDSIEPCLTSDERDNIEIIRNITHSFFEFICHDGGERIAMFIAADGINCFDSTQLALMECANQAFSSYIPSKIPSGGAVFGITSITKFVWSRELCNRDIEIFRTCTVDVLEECRDPTPAALVQNLFNYMKKATPCDNLLTVKASAVTGQETEIGIEKIDSGKNQSTEIESQPSEVSNFSCECLESKTKNAKENGKEGKNKEELSNLSKFFLNIAEIVETFPRIYQIEIKSQVFELVTKYERQMILASEKCD